MTVTQLAPNVWKIAPMPPAEVLNGLWNWLALDLAHWRIYEYTLGLGVIVEES